MTMLVSVDMPIGSGESPTKPIRTRYERATVSPRGVISSTRPSKLRSGNASLRISTRWPGTTRGMSSSSTSAAMRSGCGPAM